MGKKVCPIITYLKLQAYADTWALRKQIILKKKKSEKYNT